MKILHLGKNNYEIVKNNKDCIDEEELKSLFKNVPKKKGVYMTIYVKLLMSILM